MLNTPLRASGLEILDRDGKVLATATSREMAQAIVQMVNATAFGG